MIKVLVVDDDKLVRKGLISAMPWQEFGMQVVGEASNGAKALEFLAGNPVDLLLTDLAMPVMSGIELMREARKRYPRLPIVVLTLHQDFEYIQEALRLGAIDYIAKVQLEKEQFEVILGRIASRIQDQQSPHPHTLMPDQLIQEYDLGYVVLSLDSEFDPNWPSEWKLSTDALVMEVDRNCWMWLITNTDESKLLNILSEKVSALPESTLLMVSDLRGFTWKEIQRWVREYTERALFYEYHPDRKLIEVSMRDDQAPYTEPNQLQLEMVKEKWVLSAWFYDDEVFEQRVQDLKALRLQGGQLMGLLYSLVIEWNRLFAQTLIGKIHMIKGVHSWYQAEQWIRGIRQVIQESAHHASYSEEIMACMTKAVLLIQAEMSSQITAADMAQRLNLSRSYFSQCFKEIIGKPFNEYSRFVRIEKAKEYLLNTNKTILWIAEQTGYTDEKYFSRVFREITGMLPSEYRLTHRTGK
ncbi:response regulator transcription factor [Paenibacillus hexagrammi]|uniref:Response regulator n=1 Tax=Paenibacillus hexagrammi TaxID=2908839 RepID=A0ABY3SK85_9BACL|nr:response regulator [Paenibacillus sp. YPD9-1]UJF33550.1 response regulator [Paenibacillus sp. YPD9-1]